MSCWGDLFVLPENVAHLVGVANAPLKPQPHCTSVLSSAWRVKILALLLPLAPSPSPTHTHTHTHTLPCLLTMHDSCQLGAQTAQGHGAGRLFLQMWTLRPR